ncbi:MAG: cation transporter [Clostridia bacterium]|nr:cation transporter [Clostridia bacterium]
MKIERNIWIAFLLNLGFSVFEFFGGLLTGSVAILSDAVHDLGDAAGIGVSWFLESKSKRQPDGTYTYGYTRFSVLGSVFTCGILLLGSVGVVVSAIGRLMNPIPIHYDGMILFAVVGVAVNLTAAFVTREGESLNQKAVNLHMLEDVLTWVVVLVGAVVMRFTDWTILDPLVSIAVAVYIFIHAIGHLRTAVDIFLEKVPEGFSVEAIRQRVEVIDGISDAHHIHIRSIDGYTHAASLHVVSDLAPAAVKGLVREALGGMGITHVTVEIEEPGEVCGQPQCELLEEREHHHEHHHHH